jgi:hypothetical protein
MRSTSGGAGRPDGLSAIVAGLAHASWTYAQMEYYGVGADLGNTMTFRGISKYPALSADGCNC